MPRLSLVAAAGTADHIRIGRLKQTAHVDWSGILPLRPRGGILGATDLPD